ERQRRFTLPFACLIFFFIGAPLGAGMGMSGSATPGAGMYGPGAAGPDGAGMYASEASYDTIVSALLTGTAVVTEPEYVYTKHGDRSAIVAIEPLYNYEPRNQVDTGYAFLTASADSTAQTWSLEGKIDLETGAVSIASGRVFHTYKDEHRQGLTDASLSSDERYLLTASYDEKGRLWTVGNQQNVRAYLGAKDRLWAIAAAPNSEYVAAACNDGRVYFWAPMTVEKLFDEDGVGVNIPNHQDCLRRGEGFEESGHEGAIYDFAFSPNSQYCATVGRDGTLRLWDVGTSYQKWLYKQQNRLADVDVSPREVWTEPAKHADMIYSVRFSDDGGYILTASRDKTARIWSAATGQELCRFIGHTGAVRKAIFLGASVLTASDDGTVKLWDVGNAAAQQQGAGAMGGSMSAAPGYSMGGSMSSPMSGSMGTPMTGSMGTPMSGSMGTPMSGDPSMGSGYPDSGMTAQQQGPVQKPVRAVGKTKGVELVSFEAGVPMFSVAATPDGSYVLGGGSDGDVRIWRVPGAAGIRVDLYGNNGQNGAGYNGSASGYNGSASGYNGSASGYNGGYNNGGYPGGSMAPGGMSSPMPMPSTTPMTSPMGGVSGG
ncbi:MAG: hypothetical protein HUK22_03775, partial [Thermoguttaceae bacterium]|nr:hypothetical protein [Thermoguttaceae bacterium]